MLVYKGLMSWNKFRLKKYAKIMEKINNYVYASTRNVKRRSWRQIVQKSKSISYIIFFKDWWTSKCRNFSPVPLLSSTLPLFPFPSSPSSSPSILPLLANGREGRQREGGGEWRRARSEWERRGALKSTGEKGVVNSLAYFLSAIM